MNHIIPFAQEFYNGKALVVVGEEQFHVQRFTSNTVPFRMNDKIIHAVISLALRGSLIHVEGTPWVIRRSVAAFPALMWF